MHMYAHTQTRIHKPSQLNCMQMRTHTQIWSLLNYSCSCFSPGVFELVDGGRKDPVAEGILSSH